MVDILDSEGIKIRDSEGIQIFDSPAFISIKSTASIDGQAEIEITAAGGKATTSFLDAEASIQTKLKGSTDD
jgi:hypothetical protein